MASGATCQLVYASLRHILYAKTHCDDETCWNNLGFKFGACDELICQTFGSVSVDYQLKLYMTKHLQGASYRPCIQEVLCAPFLIHWGLMRGVVNSSATYVTDSKNENAGNHVASATFADSD